MESGSADLTVMYITANRVPEHWAQYQQAALLRAIGATAVISVSKRPLSLGLNIVETSAQPTYWGVYTAMLTAAREARTPYVAMAEDDVLYSREHFVEHRPAPDHVSYNRSRWSLFVWEKEQPVFCLRQRLSNCTLIAPRELLIWALEERVRRWPQGPPAHLLGEVGREKVERRLGCTPVPCEEWWSTQAVVQLNHPEGIDETQQRCWKQHGQLKAVEIPIWGRADDLMRIYDPQGECQKRRGRVSRA